VTNKAVPLIPICAHFCTKVRCDARLFGSLNIIKIVEIDRSPKASKISMSANFISDQYVGRLIKKENLYVSFALSVNAQ
jgi:hypothetical protein